MQSEELICPECRVNFNDVDNVPLMLPDCGHTICQQCIEEMLQQQGVVICPEDGITAQNKNDISNFPRNCQLMKMLKKQRLSQQPIQSRQSTRNDDEFHIQPPTPEYRVQLNNLTQADHPMDICPEHLEKLEIICLTDRLRICTRCALFGVHRHHEVRSVEDVVREITSKAEGIMQIYQKIQCKQPDMVEQKYYDILTDKFQVILQESHLTVKEKFRELHQLLDLKEQKLMEQLSTLTQTLEQQTRKQLKEALQQSLSSAELWKITAKDKLVYFSAKTENGEIPLDLLNTQDYACVEKGKGILEDMERTQKLLDGKVQNIKIKKLRVDLKKGEVDKCFDNLFTLTLQLHNSPKNSVKKVNMSNDSMILQDLKRNESFSKVCSQDFFSSFCQDEPMLLKDMSMADWSEALTDDTTLTQVKSPSRDTEEYFKAKECSTTPLKNEKLRPSNLIIEKLQVPEKNLHKGSIIQQSPARKIEDQVNSLRQGISPTPKLIDNKKKKAYKVGEKFDQLWLALKSDNLEVADFSSAELQDEGVISLGEIMKTSKRVKQLKLVRNKITDEGACRLLDCLMANPHQILQSLHLSSNMITERTLDYFITLVKGNGGSLPKALYLNQTLINATKAKKKLEELRKIGYVVNI